MNTRGSGGFGNPEVKLQLVKGGSENIGAETPTFQMSASPPKVQKFLLVLSSSIGALRFQLTPWQTVRYYFVEEAVCATFSNAIRLRFEAVDAFDTSGM